MNNLRAGDEIQKSFEINYLLVYCVRNNEINYSS